MDLKLKLGDFGWVLLVGGGTLVANGTPLDNNLGDGLLNALIYNVLQFGLPAVLLTQLANERVDAGKLPAWLAYPCVVLLTIGLGVWVIAPSLYPVLGKVEWWTSKEDFNLAGSSFIWHSLGMTVYVQQRYSKRAQARLKALQEDAAERERKLAAAQLLALQARVDPALRLATIDRELLEQPERAQARLAALIAWLRALQPHVEAELSTLAREVHALRAYASLMSADALHTERLHLAGLNEPPEWPLAPLVLLPLLRPLLDEGQTMWSLSLLATSTQAELQLQALGPDAERARAAATRVPLQELARRLQAVHGEQASLQLQDPPEALPLFKISWPIAAPAATSP